MSRPIEQGGIYLGARTASQVAAPGSKGPGGLALVAAGKVRDLYDLDRDHLLFVTSDRVSAFDVVLNEGVPNKGRVLTAVATWWFEQTRDVIENHLVSTSVDDVPGLSAAERETLAGRIMIVRRTRPTSVEWVVRGYLAGSGWKEYQRTGGLWGQELPSGLEHAAALPDPMLTPTTKDDAHDLPLSLDQARERVGDEVYAQAERAAMALFRRGSEVLSQRGLLLADTKFEFGLIGDDLILIDEALTPDSSRMWPVSQWQPGTNPPAYDKQPLRDWLETLDWNKQPPAPVADPAVLERLSLRYVELCERLTGRRLSSL
ncbi:phosphoribosylaminoimidazolesuccinocarboxamide synthase [Engelhardtia mirabilis]|uniref:Phosphoribosylaminoimidazole-succinocarboxamide synthase n=1 Tax=Engelhardtia mirabilis TaxID=2528011 RepID=A0A518BKF7_9BACT|nr:Phosphoribosylaminoimidazole-succinocarboxamide synthase [Planctomycetes bacterium Pla133]QDV01785.1 Phosphoribosylaminoimidazole-succinocarboxamide synthase [Planctomycetes bacterium Pla86]